MELIVSQKRVHKINYQLILYTGMISFLFSLVRVYSTSLLFTLPLFYLCFMCGYQAILSYTIGLVVGVIFFQAPIELLGLSLLCFILLEFCQLFQSMKASYVPYLLTLIGIVDNFIINRSNLY